MKRVKLLVVIGLYVAALLWAYAAVVSPAFSYDGFTLAWPGAGAMIWVIALAVAPAMALPYSFSRPSAMIVWWLYLAAYVPSILVPAISLSMPFERLLPLQLSLLFCMGILCWLPSARLLAITRIAISPSLFWSVFLLVWLVFLGVVCAYGRASMLLTNLASLLNGGSEYDIRGEFAGAIAEFGSFLGYTCGQLAQALNPCLIAFGIVYRRKACLVAGIIGQIIIFGLVGIKSALFSTIFLPVLFLFMKRWRRSFGVALAGGLLVAIVICAIADRATDNVLYSSLLTRRTLATPGLLTGFYFEHYSQAPHAGIGYHFFHNGSVLAPPNEIGLVYFGSASVDANANLWAEGFADFGVPGIFGFTLLVAFLIWIYDSISAAHDLELAVLLAAMPALMFSNTAPTTALFTHGGIAAALLLYLAPSPQSNEEAEADPEFESASQLSHHARNLRLKPLSAPVARPERSQDFQGPEISIPGAPIPATQDAPYGNLGNLAN